MLKPVQKMFMRVLWITNILFPEVTQILLGSNELKSSGGWMLGAAQGLITHTTVKLSVATVSCMVNVLTKVEGKDITYYIIPLGKGNIKENREYNPYWERINDEVKPDVVHIHGTEYSHGYAYMQACGNDKVVISIQGMISACGYYYLCGMSNLDILSNITLRDLFKGSLWYQKRLFLNSGLIETKMLRDSQHVIGRTSWDRERVWSLNPKAKYHSCNETLRQEFYDGSIWDYNKCNKHTIFLSQAGYPLKGFHLLLKAMPLILRHYPDAKVRVAGYDITNTSSFRDILRLSGYGRYIKRLIKQLNLSNKVVFTGALNAEEMKSEYLSANVFVCPSSIENSPNSLGEAQILGVPCVASYVGGVPDMMLGCEDNLYRVEEIEMLAYKICQIFAKQDSPNLELAKIATERHNPVTNGDTLYRIYSDIIDINERVK